MCLNFYCKKLFIHSLQTKCVLFLSTDVDLTGNPQYEQAYVSNLIESLIHELEVKADSLPPTDDLFLTKMKLTEAAKNFRVRVT